MCGRLVQKTPLGDIQLLFETAGPVPNMAPRYNAAPTDPLAVVRFNPQTGRRALDLLRWGLVPLWAKDPSSGPKCINARAETVATNYIFRDAFERRRCLVPADGFYEWQKREGKTQALCDPPPAGSRRASGAAKELSMQPWMIAAAGAAVALVAALMWVAEAALPGGGLTQLVHAAAPQFALVFLAAFAAIVLLLTTAAVAVDLARVYRRLDRLARFAGIPGAAPSPRECLAAFAGTSMTRLADRVLDFASEDAEAESDRLVLQSRFAPEEARRELVCHHRDWLVRAQFATALALIVALAGLGSAQDYAHAALAGFLVPGRIAVAAVAALVLLAVCTRVAVRAMAEPLIDAIERLQLPRLEMRLLQTLSAIVASDGEFVRPGALAAPIAAANPQLERLATALEDGRDTLREAIGRLSANAATLTQTARAIADQRADAGLPAADPAAIAQLHQAITGLAATIERLPAAPAGDAPAAAGEAPSGLATKRRRAPRRNDLGSELRRLISEFD
jgi:putative SOS response-associated peptidase YedK